MDMAWAGNPEVPENSESQEFDRGQELQWGRILQCAAKGWNGTHRTAEILVKSLK